MTDRPISINSISDHHITSRCESESQPCISNSCASPRFVISNSHAKSQYSHWSYNGWDDHGREAKLRLGVSSVTSDLSIGDEVDKAAADEEGNNSADKAGDGEEPKTMDFPVIWRYGEGPCRCKLNGDVPRRKDALVTFLETVKMGLNAYQPTNTPIVRPTKTTGG